MANQTNPMAHTKWMVEAGGLFQPVADGQTQSPVVRALGEDLRHIAGVKGPQGVACR